MADAYRYDVEKMTWTEINIPEDVVEPFHAFGHRGMIYLAQQYALFLYVLDVDSKKWYVELGGSVFVSISSRRQLLSIHL